MTDPSFVNVFEIKLAELFTPFFWKKPQAGHLVGSEHRPETHQNAPIVKCRQKRVDMLFSRMADDDLQCCRLFFDTLYLPM